MAFTTKKSLLAKVRAGDEISWQEFYDTYKPLMILVGNLIKMEICATGGRRRMPMGLTNAQMC